MLSSRSLRSMRLGTAAVTVAAAALCFVPLFNVLGYEFSLAIGLISAVTGGIIGLDIGARTPDGLCALGRAWLAAAAHLVPAVALITLNMLRVRNCDYLEGLGFFALLPLASTCYAASWGVLVASVLSRSDRRWRAVALAAVLIAPLAATLWTLYAQPPIFAFDHLWGYFAGSLYDEVITIDARLLVFRLGTLLRIGAITLVLALVRRRLHFAALGAISASLVVLLATFELTLGPRLGFRVTRSDIVAALPDVVERAGLVIHLPAGLERARREAIADDHAFWLDEIETALNVHDLPTIHSYVYPSADEKARLMGGRTTMVAKPWLFEIHIHDAVAPHPLVGHELTHVVAAAFAPPPLRVSSRWGLLVNIGLVEGLAEALTPPEGDFDLDQWTRALRELHLAPDMRLIMGAGGFYSEAPRRAYTVAGSFVRFLLRERGSGPFKVVYAHGDFARAYGESLDDLVGQWERYIDSLQLSPGERAITENQFRTPSIFARVCAHEVAALRAAARSAPPAQAVELYRRIAVFLDQTPSARLDVALALLHEGDEAGFLARAEKLLSEPGLSAAERAQLLEAEGNIDWARDNREAARACFQAVAELHLGAASERLQWVRSWALGLEPSLGAPVRDYLSRKAPAAASVASFAEARHKLTNDKTLPYLLGRQLERAGACELALGYLAAAAPHPYALIEAERVRLMAACEERLHELSRAAADYDAYAAMAPSSGEAARARDAATRLRWLGAHGESMLGHGVESAR
jgi:hypothetical protein